VTVPQKWERIALTPGGNEARDGKD